MRYKWSMPKVIVSAVLLVACSDIPKESVCPTLCGTEGKHLRIRLSSPITESFGLEIYESNKLLIQISCDKAIYYYRFDSSYSCQEDIVRVYDPVLLPESNTATPPPRPSGTPLKIDGKKINVKEVFIEKFNEEDIELQLKIGEQVFPRQSFNLQYSEGPKYCVEKNFKNCGTAEITLDTSETRLKGQEQ